MTTPDTVTATLSSTIEHTRSPGASIEVRRIAVNRVREVLLFGTIACMAQALWAQTGYKQTNLVADQAGVGNHADAQLSNPWGIAFLPGDPFWIANNNGGTATTYDAQGVKQTAVVGIPVAASNPCNPGCPTGIVANSSTDFGGALFIFDTEDGILAKWNGTGNATIAIDKSAAGAVYKGLALLNDTAGNFLLAANFHSGAIEVYDHNFAPATLSGGTFTDPALPAGYAPHGVHVIGNVVFVTYAQQDAAKHDPVLGAGLGLVDLFQPDGSFLRRGMTGSTLNAPWAVVLTPANFGDFSDSVLVGNFGDGTISAFDRSGTFLNQLTDSSGTVIANPGLWELVFGVTGTGDPNTLYLTAGGSTQTHGLFATLVPSPAAGTDFTLGLSAPSATVARGGSTSLTIDASASGGFNSAINLSCSGQPTGVTCAFAPASIMPGGSSSTLTISIGSTYVPPMGYMAWAPLTGFGLLGLVFGIRHKQQAGRRQRTGIWALGPAALLLGWLLLWGIGCSSYSSSHSNPPGVQTMMVVGTSGGITHSTPVSLTIQ
jgi:uncharacterized protein (TIGR03118 family)